MRYIGVLAALIMMLAAANGAWAISVTVAQFEVDGEPIEGDSWKSSFSLRDPKPPGATIDTIWYPGATIDTIYFQIVDIVGDGAFESPVVTKIKGTKPDSDPLTGYTLVSGWTGTFAEITFTAFTGTASDSRIQFELNFLGDKDRTSDTGNFTLQMAAYETNGTLFASTDFFWGHEEDKNGVWKGKWEDPKGKGLQGYPGSWDPESPIPEPVTMAGMLLGIGCLGRYIRKRH